VTLVDIKIAQAYDTGNREDQVVRDFYIPILQESISYKRLTGYFSSQVLALAARGIAGLINNGGKMQLITSPVVSEKDYEALTSNVPEEIQKFVDAQFTKAISDLNDLASTIAYDHVRALGWMLREGFLEIRVLVPSTINSGSGIFHSKVGIVEDSEGNKISFSGSVNETAMGWSQNIEEFKVFKSWESGSAFWVNHDEALFEKYWACSSDDGFEAIPLPKDSVEKLISIAPEEIEELNLLVSPMGEERKLREYQIDAIDSWEKAGFQGILEMATGTGKTFTARECIKRWKNNKSNSLVLVVAPTQTIGSQWQEVLADMNPVTTFGTKHWKESFRDLASRTALGIVDNVVVIAIQNTACSIEFIDVFSKIMKSSENHLIIADEMHGLGAPMFRNALNPSIEARLGLTATPNRWFDDEGTQLLNDYFNGVAFSFGLHEALTWVDPQTGLTPLCPYNYFPQFVSLDPLEMDEYLDLTKRIIMQTNKTTDIEGQDKLNRLLEKRASVLKKAHGKFKALVDVINELGKISGCLVYCSDREQINEVIELVARRGITYRTFTGEEGTSPRKEFGGKSERDWILQSFEEGDIQMLIAMKCLDEGVDIPSARIGIILASTTNPREFIQRRGRLLRRAKGKQIANIYDMIVSPEFNSTDQSEVITSARKIMEKELMRVDEFASDAVNSIEVSGKILGRMLRMGDSK
jgi:superfamily II DNA or RNA helicase